MLSDGALHRAEVRAAGAVKCLTALGARVAGLLLVPHIPAYCAVLDKTLEDSRPGCARRCEAEHVHAALLQAFAVAW